MKVVILGGYGVFGSRLAELLRRDGHAVWVAGRRIDAARRIATPIGASLLEIDLTGDLSPLWAIGPDVAIDAAGPFQSYGDDPYRIARACIEQNVDYLDLADDAGFVAGVSSLDEAARTAGRRVISGASSTPGLSAVVVTELAEGLDDIQLIDTAILPGNRAPRGVSVIASIVGQAGKPAPVWRGGQWRDVRRWTERRRYRLDANMARAGYFIETPDIRLFPAAFHARSVMFRAGMELGLMNAGLRLLGAARRIWPLNMGDLGTRLIKRAADLLLPFGTDRGGMRVAVTGSVGGEPVRRGWTLIAEAGEGPYVPAIVCRALLRRWNNVPPGARACLAELPLSEIVNAMSDLRITTKTAETPQPFFMQAVLQGEWHALPPEIQALHRVQDVESFSGKAEVTRGTSAIARMAAWFFRFPPAAKDVPVTVTKTRTDTGETWERNFAGHVFRSHLTAPGAQARVRERFWPFTYELDLPVNNGAIRLPVRRGWFLDLPIPRALLPGSEAVEYVEDGVFHFDVALLAPLGAGLIVRYRGFLRPDPAGSPEAAAPALR